MPDVDYTWTGAGGSLRHLDELADLYADVFAEHPYYEGPEEVAQFRRWFQEQLRSPGFSLVRALVGKTLVGMAYGFTMPVAGWWGDAVEAPPDLVIGHPKFAIMEWAVRAGDRRLGIGRQLMDELLRQRTEPYATLQVNPAALARGIYLRWGWESCGRTRGRRPMEIMLLRLAR